MGALRAAKATQGSQKQASARHLSCQLTATAIFATGVLIMVGLFSVALSSCIQVKLSSEAIAPILGSAVLMVLEQTKIVKGADWDPKAVMATTSLMSGIKSNRSLVSKAKYLEISLKDATIRVMPTQREQHGNGSGWLHLPDYEECCTPAPDLVRDLILKKLKQCC